MKELLFAFINIILIYQVILSEENPYKKYIENLPFDMPEIKPPTFPDYTKILMQLEMEKLFALKLLQMLLNLFQLKVEENFSFQQVFG